MGIGIAVPLGLLLLAALVFFVFKSKKQGQYLKHLQRKDHEAMEPYSHRASTGQNNTQGHMTELGDVDRPYELGGAGRHEIAAGYGPSHEFSGRDRHEMSST